ncbi:hypothetical protein CHIBA101_1413 [Actinomyces sp. Chiba101]|nr:hypothetical protein CHIBA101_1413 [Actinomyces sp. Chiba101]GAV95497.1 hypothetical protein ADENT20671_2292 [Actinomyces denticolens]
MSILSILLPWEWIRARRPTTTVGVPPIAQGPPSRRPAHGSRIDTAPAPSPLGAGSYRGVVVPPAGLEPARLAASAFKAAVSTGSTTGASRGPMGRAAVRYPHRDSNPGPCAYQARTRYKLAALTAELWGPVAGGARA